MTTRYGDRVTDITPHTPLAELERIKARLAAVPQGPWHLHDDEDGYNVGAGKPHNLIAYGAHTEGYIDGPEIATFVAHAPTDIAALVAEVETLRVLASWVGYDGHQVPEDIYQASRAYKDDGAAIDSLPERA